jgi:hypothetical protein
MLDANSSASQFDLMRVVTLHATVMASGLLTYLMGCGVTSEDSYKVCKWQWLVEYRIKMNA